MATRRVGRDSHSLDAARRANTGLVAAMAAAVLIAHRPRRALKRRAPRSRQRSAGTTAASGASATSRRRRSASRAGIDVPRSRLRAAAGVPESGFAGALRAGRRRLLQYGRRNRAHARVGQAHADDRRRRRLIRAARSMTARAAMHDFTPPGSGRSWFRSERAGRALTGSSSFSTTS